MINCHPRQKVYLITMSLMLSALVLGFSCLLLVAVGFGAERKLPYPMTKEMFLSMAEEYKAQVSPYGALVQSYLETGGWTSELWRRGTNGAGIKADSQWKSSGLSYVVIQSPEWSREKGRYMQYSLFRAYDSPKAFMKDYASKISTDYPLCSHTNLFKYFSGLYKGRKGAWATDHRYFEKLVDTSVKLVPRWKLLSAYEDAKGSLEPWQQEILRRRIFVENF